MCTFDAFGRSLEDRTLSSVQKQCQKENMQSKQLHAGLGTVFGRLCLPQITGVRSPEDQVRSNVQKPNVGQQYSIITTASAFFFPALVHII